MRRIGSWLTVMVVLLLCSAGTRAGDRPPTDKIGKPIDAVACKPIVASSGSLHDLKGREATVVVFLSLECPVSSSYVPLLCELARQYQDKGVAFVGIAVNEDLDPAELARQVRDFKFTFPVIRDVNHAAVAAFQARRTPEAFVLDSRFVLRYRGRIDNGYAARLKKNRQVTRHDLQQALDEVLAGKPVTEPATVAVGCPIVRERPERAAGTGVTFYKDVLPVLQNHCQTCHRPGAVGPFSLLTYRQAVNWASDIKEYTETRKMPPWKPVEGPAFHHERKLSERDLATLAAWVDGGTPEGDPKDAPPPRRFTGGWQFGKPDLMLIPEADFQLAASGNDVFRCFVLPTHLAEDRYVVAVDLRPGNPRVVHHSLLFLDTTGRARKLAQAEQERKKGAAERESGPGYSTSMGVGFAPTGALGGWAPGQQARELPDGTGYYLPRGSDVIMQVHYHRDGRPEADRTTLGLYFAKKPVRRRFQSLVIPGRFFVIPRGEEHYHVQGSVWCRNECTLYSVMPHMHMLGREVKIRMTPPNAPTRTLIAIKDWDYNWQETYFLKEPISVPAGTRFDIEAVYDNTDNNPSNPFHPPRPVFFGQETTNEMCYGFLGVASDRPGRIRADRRGPEAKP